jgi:hypothetical protein
MIDESNIISDTAQANRGTPMRSNTHSLTFGIPADLLQALRQASAKDERSLAHVVRFALGAEMQRRGLYAPPKATPENSAAELRTDP